jgi:hypothetical protein
MPGGGGRWACRRGWGCGPGAAQADGGRSRLAAGSAVTCGNGWWACQDLNLGPHPYQQSRAYRHATARLCRSLATVEGEVMRCEPTLSELGRAEVLDRAVGLEPTQSVGQGALAYAVARRGCCKRRRSADDTGRSGRFTRVGPPCGPAGGGRRIPPRARVPRPPRRWRTRHRPATPGPAACSGSDGSSRRARPR